LVGTGIDGRHLSDVANFFFDLVKLVFGDAEAPQQRVQLIDSILINPKRLRLVLQHQGDRHAERSGICISTKIV
jgi:hypothetical protein